MDSFSSKVMPETLLTTKALDQQLPIKFQLMMYAFIHRLTLSVTTIHISIYYDYANINKFMHSVSGRLHGILVLSKIKYPIASEGLRAPDPLLQRFNTEGSPFRNKSQICH